MKALRFFIVLGAIAALAFGVKAFLSSLEKPAEGKVEVVVIADPMINDMGGVDGTTVMTEEEASAAATETVEVEEEVAQPSFVALPFNGNLNKFAKKYKGLKVKLPKTIIKTYGTKKGVRVGDDVYFQSEDGSLWVFHAGKFIMIQHG